MIPTFSLLALAIVALWFSGDERAAFVRRHLWVGLWLVSLVAALFGGVVTTWGAVFALAFAGATFAFKRARGRWQTGLLAIVVLGLSIGFMLHWLPGFHNQRVINAVKFTPDARPFTLYLNFDKTLIGLFILGWLHLRITRLHDWKTMLTTGLPLAASTIVVLMSLSLATGYIQLAPKVPAESWLWLGVNLLFVCTAEEALFRGFIQTQLQRLWSANPLGSTLALIIASTLFGLAHFWGGWTYVALATIAGLGYGWIYQRTQRIEASILAHWALNCTHFFLFTYPALATGN